jgi:hypothetical protein
MLINYYPMLLTIRVSNLSKYDKCIEFIDLVAFKRNFNTVWVIPLTMNSLVIANFQKLFT